MINRINLRIVCFNEIEGFFSKLFILPRFLHKGYLSAELVPILVKTQQSVHCSGECSCFCRRFVQSSLCLFNCWRFGKLKVNLRIFCNCSASSRSGDHLERWHNLASGWCFSCELLCFVLAFLSQAQSLATSEAFHYLIFINACVIKIIWR